MKIGRPSANKRLEPVCVFQLLGFHECGHACAIGPSCLAQCNRQRATSATSA